VTQSGGSNGAQPTADTSRANEADILTAIASDATGIAKFRLA
jgi:hypothetical protein